MNVATTTGPTAPLVSSGKSKDVPPGLARRGLELPPGIARKLESGGTPPAGIGKRFPAANAQPSPVAEPAPATPPSTSAPPTTGTTAVAAAEQTPTPTPSVTSPVLDLVV